MPKPTKSTSPVVSLKPSITAWKELAVLAETDLRNLPQEALAIIHEEFVRRFPKGIQEYINKNPNSVVANMHNGDAE